MTWYAIKDGQRVLRCVQSNTQPEGGEALTSYAGMPAAGGSGRELRVSNGALHWYDARSLAAAKTERLVVMRVAREAAIHGGFVWSGSTFDSDEKAQFRLLSMAISAQLPGFVAREYRLANNTYRTLTAANATAVYKAFDAHVQDQFARFALRDAAVNAATTVAAVDAVVWE